MTRSLLATFLVYLIVQPLAFARASAETPAEMQTVEVSGIKNPELRSYRKMMAGLDAFDSYRHLAPKADVLRFRLKPRHADEPLAGVTLRISGSATSIELPIAADGSFVLPRDLAAFDDDADLVLNRKRGAYSGVPLIHSAGVPPTMRRLGDIRLECRVAVAIAKQELNFALRAAASVVMAGGDWCKSSRIHYGTAAPYPSDSITLTAGARRAVLHAGSQQKHFPVPLSDNSWPDDTLIEFQRSEAPSVAHFSAHQLYLSGSMNKWGATLPFKQIDATQFRVELALPAGVSRFKVVSKDRRAVDLGAADTRANLIKGQFQLDQGKTLAPAGDDIWFEPPNAGVYAIGLNVADPAAPVLTVSALGPAPATQSVTRALE
ncbi:MAG: hypothetical protein V4723_18365 [Pseudomonadota bacterium]